MKRAGQTGPAGGISDELLQRYFDGELSAAESVELEPRLDADARLRLEALGELRVLLRAEAAAEAVDLSGTIDAIARSAAPPPAPRRRVPRSAVGGLLAAVAALVFFLRPVTPNVMPSLAEVESLDVAGAVATVFEIDNGADSATIIWADEADVEETP